MKTNSQKFKTLLGEINEDITTGDIPCSWIYGHTIAWITVSQSKSIDNTKPNNTCSIILFLFLKNNTWVQNCMLSNKTIMKDLKSLCDFKKEEQSWKSSII